jgi:FdhD protein
MSKYQTQPHSIEVRSLASDNWTTEHKADLLAVEEPLEIRICHRQQERALSITMRTPGHDLELAMGFLFGEGIIRSADQVLTVHETISEDEALLGQRIAVHLSDDCCFDAAKLERHFYTTSSCGVCGKSSIDAVKIACPIPVQAEPFRVSHQAIAQLPEALKTYQRAFEQTGGIHAAAFFDAQGAILQAREDVGRHNALDKLNGWALSSGQIPVVNRGLLLSGRASFELIQKASMAGVPMIVAVGAPSSLAVELAEELNITLVGFAKPHRFNVYSAAERIHA